jgi:hypothetical protein
MEMMACTELGYHIDKPQTSMHLGQHLACLSVSIDDFDECVRTERILAGENTRLSVWKHLLLTLTPCRHTIAKTIYRRSKSLHRGQNIFSYLLNPYQCRRNAHTIAQTVENKYILADTVRRSV